MFCCKKYMLIIALFFPGCVICSPELGEALLRLQRAYPEHIVEVAQDYIVWFDGTVMQVGALSNTAHEKLTRPSLYDHLVQPLYIVGHIEVPPCADPGRIRYEPIFKKMYGATPEDVESHLVTVRWMPRVFGDTATELAVTTVNDIHVKIMQISHELEELVFEHPEIISFLERPAGTYCWRLIANTDRLSPHSFGMTLDINAACCEYWQWDLQKSGVHIAEDAPIIYRNSVPWPIVEIFEKYGFIWGGKWYHYDTMHFEYRPELVGIP